MRTPYTKLYLHCVWATWDRMPLIPPERERPLYTTIAAKCNKLGCEIIALNGMADHVHVLVRFPTTLSVADLVKEMKGSSSHLMTHEVAPGEFFKWQGAYGAFTVGKDAVDTVSAYIHGQKAHHTAHSTVQDWESCETSSLGD